MIISELMQYRNKSTKSSCDKGVGWSEEGNVELFKKTI